MAKDKKFSYTEQPKERGFLVGVDLKTHRFQTGTLNIEDSMNELAALADTAQINVIGGTYQRLNRPHPGSLIRSGKLEEIKAYKEELEVDVFVFDEELSPRQQRVLESQLETKVIDRTALILDIFARHARTKEGMLQVELAQLEYRLPRLTRMWTHLARQAGGRAGGASGGVGLRGPGETQLEIDRREINRKISHVKKQLEGVRAHRNRQRIQRKQANIAVIGLVGYTNAGKSTLLNTVIEKAGIDPNNNPIYVADQLFATLDPTTRRIKLPQGKEVLFSDTVGFIQKLPTQLIAAFRATLEEVVEADMLLHVVDINHPNAVGQVKAVEETLQQLEAGEIPIVTVLNKIDMLPPETNAQLPNYPDSLPISAQTGEGITDLLTAIEEQLENTMIPFDVHIPYSEGKLVSLLHEQAIIETENYTETGTYLKGQAPKYIVGRLKMS